MDGITGRSCRLSYAYGESGVGAFAEVGAGLMRELGASGLYDCKLKSSKFGAVIACAQVA